MTYRTSGGYRSGASYSFSSRPSGYMSGNNINLGSTNNFDVSYSRRTPIGTFSDFNYVGGGSEGISYDTKGGNSSFGMGRRGGRGIGSRGNGRGMGRGGGKGINRSKGQGKGIANKGQKGIDMQNQFVVEREDNDSLTEIDSAIKNLNLSDLPQNQIITQQSTQLELKHYKKITFVKKQLGEEHLEIIIKEVELLNKKSRKAILR